MGKHCVCTNKALGLTGEWRVDCTWAFCGVRRSHILLWVEHAVLLEDFAHDRHRRVDRVGDDKDKGAWAVPGHTFS